jgi:multicomponent Na+:H+ antiporter subunit E
MTSPLSVRTLAWVVWTTLVWVALWSTLSLPNVIWGVVIGYVTLAIAPGGTRHRLRVQPLALLRFAGWFAWALVKASAMVAWEIVTPGSRINEAIVAAPLRTSSPALATLIANAITLTPGTLTLEIGREPPRLYIHILHLRSIEDVRADIEHLEDLVLAAFPAEASRTIGPP